MQLGRIPSAEGGGYSTLGVSGRAVEQRALGDDENVIGLRGTPGGVEACDAASHDEKPRSNPVGHDRESISSRGAWEVVAITPTEGALATVSCSGVSVGLRYGPFRRALYC